MGEGGSNAPLYQDQDQKPCLQTAHILNVQKDKIFYLSL